MASPSCTVWPGLINKTKFTKAKLENFFKNRTFFYFVFFWGVSCWESLHTREMNYIMKCGKSLFVEQLVWKRKFFLIFFFWKSLFTEDPSYGGIWNWDFFWVTLSSALLEKFLPSSKQTCLWEGKGLKNEFNREEICRRNNLRNVKLFKI